MAVYVVVMVCTLFVYSQEKYTNMENWKTVTIDGFSNFMVSDLGRVKRVDNNKNLSTNRMHRKGYPIVRLHRYGHPVKTFFVHRLVATAFVENPNNYPQVNHIDCDKTNNKASNLEWCTNMMNHLHAKKNGLLVVLRGESHGSSLLTEKQVLKIRDMHAMGYSRKAMAEKFNTKPTNIKDIVARRSWKHI